MFEESAAYLVLAAIGVATGIINTLAGGGSLITLPVLSWAGLPADAANATNRVGVLLQSAAASESFRRGGALMFSQSRFAILVTLVGAIVGTLASVQLTPALMRNILGGAMVLLVFVVAFNPKRWVAEQGGIVVPLPLRFLGFFAIGVYGGLVQAGVGLFLLVGSVYLDGTNIVQANARKNLVVAVYTVPALCIFAANGLVDWGLGLSLAFGGLVGGLIGVRLALRLGPGFVRGLLIVIASAGALYLLVGET